MTAESVARPRATAVRWAAGTSSATAGFGALALQEFHGANAPSPLFAALVAASLAAAAVVAAERRGGLPAGRVAAAMVELAILGWIVQSRAPVSNNSGGGSTAASVVALQGTVIWGLAATAVFVLATCHGQRLLRWRAMGGVVGAALVMGLLIAPFVPGIGTPVNGVRSWVAIGPISGQPGELGRVLLLVFLAVHLDLRTPTLALTGTSRCARLIGAGSLADLVRVFGAVGVALLLLVAQDDLGPAILIVAVTAAMAWMATGRLVYPSAAIAGFVGGVAAILALGLGAAQKVAGRLDAWQDPFGDGNGVTVNAVALQAQARGGLLGRGLGTEFDPYWVAARNDYILPQVHLRLGIAGVFVACVLLGVIVHGMLDLGRDTPPAVRLFSTGAACLLGFQALLIAAGSTSAFVLTGVPFPFLSYGGSSLLCSALLVGLVIGATGAAPATPAAERTRIPATTALGSVMLLLALAVSSKTLATATVDADSLSQRRDNPWNTQPLSLDRGRILAADGVVLARSAKRNGIWVREYPFGSAASGVTGWASRTGSLGGAELAFDDRLAAGDDVRLTIDSQRQVAAYEALGGRRGSVAAIDVETGGIVALASSPGFDPELLSSPHPEEARAARGSLPGGDAALIASAYQDRFAPGSIFKVVTTVAAVDAGLDPEEDYPARSSWTTPDGVTIGNASGMLCGGDLVAMLEVSCNTTAVKIGVEVGLPTLRDAADSVGLGDLHLIELPNAAGVGFPTDHEPLDLALTSIGQGDVGLSALQAAVMAATSTHGALPRPHLDASNPPPGEIPGPSEAARSVVRNGMAACISSGTCMILRGTTAQFAKTGTAEAGDRRNAWIITSDTDLAVAVVLRGDHGERLQGSQDAGPVAIDVLSCCTTNEGAN